MARPADPEAAFFSTPTPPSRRWRWALVGCAAASAATLWVLEPWRPEDRAAGRHPAARLAPDPASFDTAVRHRGQLVALAAGGKADPRRALLQLTIAEPVASVALVDDGDEIAWSADWPKIASTFRLDVDPGRWRYVQGREDLRALNGPRIEERQQLDLRAGQVWALWTTASAAPDGGATFGRPAVVLP